MDTAGRVSEGTTLADTCVLEDLLAAYDAWPADFSWTPLYNRADGVACSSDSVRTYDYPTYAGDGGYGPGVSCTHRSCGVPRCGCARRASASVRLTAAAASATGPWNVAVVELGGAPGAAPQLDAALDRTQVASGDAVTLTVTVPPDAPRGGLHVLGLVSSSGGTSFVWPLLVLTP